MPETNRHKLTISVRLEEVKNESAIPGGKEPSIRSGSKSGANPTVLPTLNSSLRLVPKKTAKASAARNTRLSGG